MPDAESSPSKSSIHAVLLDTHVFLWTILDPARLSQRCSALVADPDIALYLSAASVWEIALKAAKGKLVTTDDVVDSQIEALGIKTISISTAHIRAMGRIAFADGHKDPFDRLIAAQAKVERLPLLTADVSLRGVPDIQTIWR